MESHLKRIRELEAELERVKARGDEIIRQVRRLLEDEEPGTDPLGGPRRDGSGERTRRVRS